MSETEDRAEVVHIAPPIGTAKMPCCGRTPLEVDRADRMTVHRDLATCQTDEGDTRRTLAEAWFDGYDKGNLDGYFGTRDERKKSPYAELDPYRETGATS